MKLIFLLFVGLVLYFIARGYKTQDFQHINIHKKQRLTGDLKDHEAGLLVALLAKVAKADGGVCELEAQMLSHTFSDIASHFESSEQIRQELKTIYENEKKTFDNTLQVSQKLYALTKKDYKKRLKVMEYLLNLAFIDGDFTKTEFMICEDIAGALHLQKSDFEALVTQFEQFYAQRAQSQKLSLEKAYEVLELTGNEDMSQIKKQYRALVKKNHPDIVTGQGASQSIIDEATQKLQEINEAYELIKKERG